MITAPSKSTLTTCSRCGTTCWSRNKDPASDAAVKLEAGNSKSPGPPVKSASSSHHTSNVRSTEPTLVSEVCAVAPQEVIARPITGPVPCAIVPVEPTASAYRAATAPVAAFAPVVAAAPAAVPAARATEPISRPAPSSAASSSQSKPSLKFPLHGGEELFFQVSSFGLLVYCFVLLLSLPKVGRGEFFLMLPRMLLSL